MGDFDNWTQEQLIHKFFELYDYHLYYGGAEESLKLLRPYIKIERIENEQQNNLTQKQFIDLFIGHYDLSIIDNQSLENLRDIRSQIEIETLTGETNFHNCRTCSIEIPTTRMFCKKCEQDFLLIKTDIE